MCRELPKKARKLVRDICDGKEARSITIAETKAKTRTLTRTCTCFCGKMFATGTALAVHAFKAHGVSRPISRYAFADNSCLNCLLQFSTRNGLIAHLEAGQGICLLNTLLRVPPTTDDEEMDLRAAAQKIKLCKQKAGTGRHAVDFPAFRIHGPMWKMIDMQGQNVLHTDKRHPVGPGSQIRCP